VELLNLVLLVCIVCLLAACAGILSAILAALKTIEINSAEIAAHMKKKVEFENSEFQRRINEEAIQNNEAEWQRLVDMHARKNFVEAIIRPENLR